MISCDILYGIHYTQNNVINCLCLHINVFRTKFVVMTVGEWL